MTTTKKREVYWCGEPETCCLCGQQPKTGFADAKLGSSWGTVCQTCLGPVDDAAFGQGRGQFYARQPDGRWLKTKG